MSADTMTIATLTIDSATVRTRYPRADRGVAPQAGIDGAPGPRASPGRSSAGRGASPTAVLICARAGDRSTAGCAWSRSVGGTPSTSSPGRSDHRGDEHGGPRHHLQRVRTRRRVVDGQVVRGVEVDGMTFGNSEPNSRATVATTAIVVSRKAQPSRRRGVSATTPSSAAAATATRIHVQPLP